MSYMIKLILQISGESEGYSTNKVQGQLSIWNKTNIEPHFIHYTKIFRRVKNRYVKTMEFWEKIQNNIFLTLK